MDQTVSTVRDALHPCTTAEALWKQQLSLREAIFGGEHADWSSLGSLGLSLGLARGQKLLGTLRTEHWSRFSGADDPT